MFFRNFIFLFQGIEQRHQNLLRWAMNLTRDCNTVEDKIKYLRPGIINYPLEKIRLIIVLF